jgi:hypothetical protein
MSIAMLFYEMEKISLAGKFKELESIVKSTGGFGAISFMILSMESFQLLCWKYFTNFLVAALQGCFRISKALHEISRVTS